MPKQFTYAKHGESWGLEVTVDDETYQIALATFAECFKVLGTENTPLPESSVEYLVQYGVNQTTQDSMAGPAAKANEEGGDAVAASIGAADKRWDSIANGEAGIRGGGFRATSPLEKATREITDLFVKKGTKGKMPKGDALAKARESFYKANKSAIDKLAADRVAAESAIEIELPKVS